MKGAQLLAAAIVVDLDVFLLEIGDGFAVLVVSDESDIYQAGGGFEGGAFGFSAASDVLF